MAQLHFSLPCPQCGENVSAPFCLQGTLEKRCFCHKDALLSAFLLWLNWVSLLRCTPARCTYFFSNVQMWMLDSILFYLQLCLNFFFTFILPHCELDDAWKIHFFKPALKFHWKYCAVYVITPSSSRPLSNLYPLGCISLGNHGCLTCSVLLCVTEDFAAINLQNKT